MRFYSIGEFAELIDVSTVTLRNWEKRGMLLPHHKSPSGYRYYSEKQVEDYLNPNSDSSEGGDSHVRS